ncbi:MAG TPA: class I SAM-dependent methyltransferase [Terriglobales bacterium]|nr:class I SAM-dependent methyltransferase [Terriglobales bacterium]
MYSLLAEYYDELMEADYRAFFDYYQEVWARYGLTPQIVLDLACGTGNMAKLYEAKYDVIGVDISPEMLSKAREKLSSRTLLLAMDMRALDLYGTVDACCCTLDGFGSMLCEEDFLKALSGVNLFLSPGGILIFDLITPGKFKDELDGSAYFYDTKKVSCVWRSALEEPLCNFYLTYFILQGEYYTRRDETWAERVWSAGEVETLIAACGMELLEVREDEGRMFFVCRKGGKTGNWN